LTGDDDTLRFTHIRHVERVLDETGSGDIEGTCLTCHQPSRDGLGFEPIQFDRSCTTCHLGPDAISADLDIAPVATLARASGGGATLRLGVETVETARRRGGPGDGWATTMSTAQFEEFGGVVTKIGIAHKDPWITHNLRNLRRALFPSQGLADLLVASADVDPRDRRVLYDEAIRTLRGYATGLEGRSETWVQEELAEISRSIAELEARIADPATPLSATKFLLDRTPNPALTAEQVTEINAFAETVAQPCLMCHRLTDATLARPAADQRVLRRSVFNHRAHVIQRGCLQCHTEIPFLEYLDTGERADDTLDRAAIQNIPRIEVCRECHVPDKAATACRTCHVFHPGSDSRADLPRAVR
jgi:hypothetical protein